MAPTAQLAPQPLAESAYASHTASLPAYLKYFPGAFFFQKPDLSLSYISESIEHIFPNCDLKYLKANFLQLLHHQDRFELIQNLKNAGPKVEVIQLHYRLKHPNLESIA